MQYFDDVTSHYIHSKRFEGLAFNSKRIYMTGIDTLLLEFGGMPVKKITRPMVIKLRDNLYHQPGKCRIALKVLNNILNDAFDNGWVPTNVAARIGDLPPQKEIERWQENEIDQFLQTAPVHVKDAMVLALYTGQRRSDLIRMKWSDIKDDMIHVQQRKTGVELWIPIHPKLRQHLDGMKKRLPLMKQFSMDCILTNHYGQPYVPEALHNAFKRHCNKIGLRHKQLHGVRKTTASILGEAGCSALQIMAITGHQSLKEVDRYTHGAEKKKLAQQAMAKWQ